MTSCIYRQLILCFLLVFCTSLYAAGEGKATVKTSNQQVVSAINPFVDKLVKQASPLCQDSCRPQISGSLT